MKTETTKTELNHIKIGIFDFQLEAGDLFKTNGKSFDYYPIGQENQTKCPRGSHLYRPRYYHPHISAKKHMKDVMNAENIELLVNKDDEGNTTVYEVKYASKVEIPKNEPLLMLTLALNSLNSEWKFESQELEVQRETKETYYLKKYNPITNYIQTPKSTLDIVQRKSNTYFIIGKVEDYTVLESNLYKFVEKSQNEKIQNAKDHLQKSIDNLANFYKIKATVNN